MAKSDIVERTKVLIAAGESARAAIAKGTQSLYQAVELVRTPEAAESLLAQSESFLTLARRRLKGDTEAVNEIHRGRFALMALIGAMCPPVQGKRSDTEEEDTSHSRSAKFHRNTLRVYRTINEHWADVDGYFQSLTAEDDDLKEASRDGFVRHIQTALRHSHGAQHDTERRQQSRDLGPRATPDKILAITNSPLILLGPHWFMPGGAQTALDEVEEKGAWELAKRLDPAGAYVVFRTLGLDAAIERAYHLRNRWGLAGLGWQINVGGMKRLKENSHASEQLVVCTHGRPDVPDKLPKLDNNGVRCPATGVEQLVLSWFEDFVSAKGTQHLVIEIGGTGQRKGFQRLPIEELEAAGA
jgi:hypothetical protein